MTSRTAKRWFLPLLLASLYLALATGSAAAEVGATHLKLLLDEGGKVGEELTVKALVSQGGASPVPGVEVVFYTTAEFSNVHGEIELGRAVTDDEGVASLTYVPRSQGEQTIIVRYGAEEAKATILISPALQLYEEEAGVNVPGIGVWLLASTVGAAWGAFLIQVVLLGFIARNRPGRSSHQIRRARAE